MQTLIKNTNAYRLLKTEILKDGHSHAYLVVFDDPKHLKTALRSFAKLLFYAEENDYGEYDDPALKRVADLIEGDKYPDCLVYPRNEKRLTAEEAEEIVEECAVRPVEGERKVFLIDKFDEALPAAQNKLLKVLEEPPQGVVFLLGARTVYPVLTTVRSRTQKLEILPFSLEEVGACMRRNYSETYSEQQISLVSALSCGSVGSAENFLLQGYYQSVVEDAFALCLSDPFNLPAVVKKVSDKHKKELLTLIRLIFRDALFLKTALRGGADKSTLLRRAEKHLFLRPEKKRIESVSEKYTLRSLIFAQDKLTEAEKQLKFNANFTQCIEICIASILEENK
ncbi:MAG: hypothetical protein IJX98_03010 [Clostridia bacterium]|nr:hypothetical protein [Clostridia bacterium]